jgi:predicted DNA-binding transcriptional regulator AlpA
MSNATHSRESEPLALTSAEVARLLEISERHLWTLNSTARVPKPIRLGRSIRWNAAELREWLQAGAPERSIWETMRSSGK